MIVDLERFLAEEGPRWKKLESMLDRLESDPERRLELSELTRFHELYQRCSADLAKIATFSGEPAMRLYLEGMVARAYGEIHETREKVRFHPWRWFAHDFPVAFRRQAGAFWLSLGVTLLGCLFGAGAVYFDPEAKQVIMPFPGLNGNPADRVKQEESARSDRLAGKKSNFAAELMTHNTRVTIFTMALGVSWGSGTALVLFYNGVILGAVSLDYVRAGQARFLMGWLLPHGAIEIPSILIGGQAGFVLANALIGWGRRTSRRERLRKISPDLIALIQGAGVMLVWAGIVEAFLSQYHEPVIPYAMKIGFGVVELIALTIFLSRAGTHQEAQ
ncbi:MAG: stage II sporulation protein M [Acidobacteriota bacterium]|nr:stage II sporulation protein M [Acidobacteriota bacterium]